MDSYQRLDKTQKYNFLFLLLVFVFVMCAAIVSHSYKKNTNLLPQETKKEICKKSAANIIKKTT
jgi:Na+-transporting methylmalonyl-CoA/oxaloacetate decarboxylase gamma subunit